MPIFLDMHMAEIIPEAITMTFIYTYILSTVKLLFITSVLCHYIPFIQLLPFSTLLSAKRFCYVVVQLTETEVPQWKIV